MVCVTLVGTRRLLRWIHKGVVVKEESKLGMSAKGDKQDVAGGRIIEGAKL
jgi:hypothetical protein